MEHTLELSTDCQNHSKEGQPYVAVLSVSTITHTLEFILICTLFRCINVPYGQKLYVTLWSIASISQLRQYFHLGSDISAIDLPTILIVYIYYV